MSMLLEVNGISVSFDGFKAINDLSFSIGYNELRAITVSYTHLTLPTILLV